MDTVEVPSGPRSAVNPNPPPSPTPFPISCPTGQPSGAGKERGDVKSPANSCVARDVVVVVDPGGGEPCPGPSCTRWITGVVQTSAAAPRPYRKASRLRTPLDPLDSPRASSIQVHPRKRNATISRHGRGMAADTAAAGNPAASLS